MKSSVSEAHGVKPIKLACRRLGEEGNLLVVSLPLDNEPEKIVEVMYETSPEARRAMVVAVPEEAKKRFSTYSLEIAAAAGRLFFEYYDLSRQKKEKIAELRLKERRRFRKKRQRMAETAGIVQKPQPEPQIKPQTIGFMDLNYDCRRLIYDALFPDDSIGVWARQPDKPMWDESKTIRYRYPALKVLQLSKTINREASEVYYGKNFLFIGHRASWVVLDSFLSTIRPQNYQFLRHLTIALPQDEYIPRTLEEDRELFCLERVERVTNLTVSDRIWYSKVSDIWEDKRKRDDNAPQVALGDACEKLAKLPNLCAIDLVYPTTPIYYPASLQDLYALRDLQHELPQLRFRIVVLHSTKKEYNSKQWLYYEAWDDGEETSLLNMACNIGGCKDEMDPKCRLAWALDDTPQKWEVHEGSLQTVLGMNKGHGEGPEEEDWDGVSWADPSKQWDFDDSLGW